jgi:predicted kinase
MTTILVNGLPGAGKTTLARELAGRLGLPLLSKDAVKETLAGVLPRPADRDEAGWSRELGRAAAETLWTLLRDAPGGAVLDGFWLPPLRLAAAAGLRRAGRDPAAVTEVWCRVPPEVARARVAARAPYRHSIHAPGDGRPAGEWEEWDRTAAPLALGPVLVVETSHPVDIAALARRVTARPAPEQTVAAHPTPSDTPGGR